MTIEAVEALGTKLGFSGDAGLIDTDTIGMAIPDSKDTSSYNKYGGHRLLLFS